MTSLPRTWISVSREGLLDLAEVLIARSDERRHEVRARNDDGGRGLGRCHEVGELSALIAEMVAAGPAVPMKRSRSPIGDQVPALDHRVLALVAEDRHAGRVEREHAARSPASSPHQRAARIRRMWAWANSTTRRSSAASPGEHPVGPARRRRSSDSPPSSGWVHTDQPGIGWRISSVALALGLAVVPLDEVGLDLAPGRRARPARTCRGPAAAGSCSTSGVVDAGDAGEHRPQSGGEAPALVVERDVGAPGVAAGAAPLRLPVADEHHPVGHRRVTLGRHGRRLMWHRRCRRWFAMVR